MCGIVGLVQTKNAPVSRELITAMTTALSHRGPDGFGIELKDQVGLGHRRLSIIDLETGKQPLCNEDKTVWVTFNGEIYNFRELRQELEFKGHKFRTRSDTEVIVHGYEEWGDRCVERFRGMFAFGVADFRMQRLFLARDHLGIKPLYYLHSPTCFAFASEIQVLRHMPDIDFSINIQSVDQYLWLQYIPAPRTVYKNVFKLPPAHRISITFDGEMSGPEEYWKLQFCPAHNRSEEEWSEALEAVLYDSVRAHLVSDVPFGAFLSGGVDSSVVVAYMSKILNEPVKTFSIGFEEQDFSELPYAEIVASQWGTDHHVEIVKPNALDILPNIVKHYGEPFGDSSAIPTYYVCKMARKFVPMVLSGDGGDEAFAGYHSYRTWMERLSSLCLPTLENLFYPIAHAIFPRRYPLKLSELQEWLQCINYIPVPLRRQLWRPEYRSVTALPLDVFEREFERANQYGRVNKVQYMDLKTYLPFDILTKVDIASMMHGLEVRTPFVDVKVIEFAATIPETLLMGKNHSGEWEGKLLLKKLMQKYYTPEFLNRSKMGFGVPIQKWFAPGGELREYIYDRLLGDHSLLNEFFEPAIIRQFFEQNISYYTWLLLFFEEWLQQNKEIKSYRMN